MMREKFPALMKPSLPAKTKILYLAEYAPDHPVYEVKNYDEDGGYPEYHHDIYRSLVDIGYSVHSSSKPYSLLVAQGNIDFVFSLWNRMPFRNSEIFVSSYCEYARIPYLGAPPNIRALAEDKYLTKLTCAALGLPVPTGRVYRPQEELIPPEFPGPYFIKDRFGAGSEGIFQNNLQEDWDGTRGVIERFHAVGKDALVEEFCPGVDVTVPVLGHDLPFILGHVTPLSDKIGNILTEDLKLEDHLGYEMIDVNPLGDQIRNDVHKIWTATGPMDYFRADYRIDFTTGQRRLLEFNICCHIGESGAICLAGEQHGFDKNDILAHVVEYSLRRQLGIRNHCQWIL